ncbi:MAG: hypothetical protein EOO48_00350 [Flavobacterium sp.]|nr:MAG: hypothetical protein EOO48_00350 [Flavobacterium sp.]
MKKIISPKMHGMMDYALGTALMTLPAMVGVNEKASGNYRKLAAGMSTLNVLTDTPAGLRKVIPFKTHKKADAGLLGMLALATMSKTIRKDPKALAFHLALLGVAGLNYALTDYNAVGSATPKTN